MLNFVVEEMVINEATDKDIAASITIFDSHINKNKKVIECPTQAWDMIDMAFNRELRREKRISSLVDMSIEGEHMVFPHIRETFYSIKVQNDDIKPSELAISEDFERMSIKDIEGMDVKGEDVKDMVHPMSPGASPKNWTTTTIPFVFLLSQ